MYFIVDYDKKKYFFYPLKAPNPNALDIVPVPFGHIILDFMEIDPAEILNLLEKESSNKISLPIDQSYFRVRSILIKKYNNAIVSLMLESLWNKHPYIGFNNDYFIDLNLAKNRLPYMRLLRYEIAQFCNRGSEYDSLKDTFINYLHPSAQDIRMQIRFENGKLSKLYESFDIASILSFDLANMQYYNIQIKQCENCWKFFIPQKRSDEKYCDRIYKKGKTCKQLGYFEKEKADPFKKLFTTARKTQYARIEYNKHIKDYRDKHYEPWLEAAQKAKKKFEADSDIDGFRQWIGDNKNSF